MAAAEKTFYRTSAAGISIRENPGLFPLKDEPNWGDFLPKLLANPLVRDYGALNSYLYHSRQRDVANFLADANHPGIYVMKQKPGRDEQLAAIGIFLGAFDENDYRRRDSVGWDYGEFDSYNMRFYKNYPATNGNRIRQVNFEYEHVNGSLDKVHLIDAMAVNGDMATRTLTVTMEGDHIFKIEDRREIIHHNLVGRVNTTGIIYAMRNNEHQPIVQEYIDVEGEESYPGSSIGWQDSLYYTPAATAATKDNRAKWLAENLPYDEAVFKPLFDQKRPI